MLKHFGNVNQPVIWRRLVVLVGDCDFWSTRRNVESAVLWHAHEVWVIHVHVGVLWSLLRIGQNELLSQKGGAAEEWEKPRKRGFVKEVNGEAFPSKVLQPPDKTQSSR